jgi:S-DNA-T family DNA segregation ATPase FtsK/SpoIIIE
LFFRQPIEHFVRRLAFFAVMVVSFNILLCCIEDVFPIAGKWLQQNTMRHLWDKGIKLHPGGAPFFYLYKDLPGLNFSRTLNFIGILMTFGSAFVASALLLFDINPLPLLKSVLSYRPNIKLPSFSFSFEKKVQPVFREEDNSRFVKVRTADSPAPSIADPKAIRQDLLEIKPEIHLKERPSLSKKESLAPPPVPVPPVAPAMPAPTAATKREAALSSQKIINGDFETFRIPSSGLLTTPKKVDQSLLKQDLKRQAEVLEETLQSFGIEAKVGQINCGPSITSFEVHPSIGVKVQRIKALENDIALNMEAKSIRIIAPIPGKAAVGIEVPNAQPQEVAFKDMLAAYQQLGKKFNIPILLGKAVNGDYVMSDLTKMPHCIIAGATGSGKSVCINTIVMSVLLNAKPDEIKLIMVDPKKVELTPYSKLPHMLAPVITEPRGACAALNWMVKEMEFRYELLKQIGVRNIDAYNSRTVNRELEDTLAKRLARDIPLKLPFIVGIIDELADLMMVSSNDIETPIARIAQMARAVGIHLILATQRPSREVITGLIKANFPTRISFKVASRVNSQIILDETGAETLLGNGDMLFLPPGTSHLTRAQGAYIRDEDINAVVKYICDQAPPNYVIHSFDEMGAGYDGGGGEGKFNDEDQPKDDLYEEALDVILSTGNASTTFLQRKLKVGYARAASIIDQLEANGVVGPADGSKPRKILAKRTQMDEEEEAFNALMGEDEL